FPIEIISGLEEARLIYKAVSYELPTSKKRLVIDIGGGSTELILGEDTEVLELRSLKMGCVSWTQRFFENGQITRERLKSAQMMAFKELSALQNRYLEIGWNIAQGTSGTIKAISNILSHHGFDENITREKLKWLSMELVALSKGKRNSIPGLSQRRSEIIAGGVSILSSIFRALEIDSLQAVRPALREGVLLEMIGRLSGDDIRQQSIQHLAERLNVDIVQSQRVMNLCRLLLHQSSWTFAEDELELLFWAAQLHEIGLFIAFSGYHRHGAYILENADLNGFSKRAQRHLAALVRFHRGKCSIHTIEEFLSTPSTSFFRLLALLRLSIRISRRREDLSNNAVHLSTSQKNINLHIKTSELEHHSLLHADLEEEKEQLAQLQLKLNINLS
ncbi:MAG: exopolyphosphatase, partial [Proteobacteria bacterium]|nr:exopolyphosphatase [Pseudomonadota bacterium]